MPALIIVICSYKYEYLAIISRIGSWPRAAHGVLPYCTGSLLRAHKPDLRPENTKVGVRQRKSSAGHLPNESGPAIVDKIPRLL